jgi:hypothetical protein
LAAALATAATVTTIPVVAAGVAQVGAQVRERGRGSRCCRPEPPTSTTQTTRKDLMPRCPRCGSAPITILFGAYPLVFCAGCGARWTQAGSDQRATKRVQGPAPFASARYPLA